MDQPGLLYNISMKRHLLSALVSRMIVPIVILIQLFVIVIVIGRDSKRLELFGVRPGAVIFTCAAFFFAVLVAQNSLRSELQAMGFVYLESFYLPHISSSSLSLSIWSPGCGAELQTVSRI